MNVFLPLLVIVFVLNQKMCLFKGLSQQISRLFCIEKICNGYFSSIQWPVLLYVIMKMLSFQVFIETGSETIWKDLYSYVDWFVEANVWWSPHNATPRLINIFTIWLLKITEGRFLNLHFRRVITMWKVLVSSSRMEKP